MMKKLILTAILGLALPFMSEAKSYSSGSHSYSSSSSHSSSSSYHSSSSSSSYHSSPSSSSSSSSSHSYSSGSHSYASGSSSSPSKSSTKTASSGGSSGSSGSYKSSAGKTYTTTSHSEDAPAHTYASGSTSSSKPRSQVSSIFDSDAAVAHQKDESRQTYTQAKAARTPSPVPSASSTYDSTYTGTTPTYTHKSYASSAPTYTKVYVPSQTIIVTRPARLRQFYSPYYSRPSVSYSDSYNSLFWWWLLDQSIDTQANWAYHHRYSMDSLRYQTMMQNAELAARVQQLENQQVARNQNYTPYGLQQQDLMYNDQYIQAASTGQIRNPGAAGHALFVVFGLMAFLTISGCVIWLIFIKRW